MLIAFDTKHGNTKKVAEMIADGIKTNDVNEVSIENVKDIDMSKDITYDLIVIGSPNHVGRHTKSVKKFIKSLSNAPLKGKSFVVFDTYMSKDFEKTVKKMEKQINGLMPDLTKANSGLSIKVGGMKGPIIEEDIPKCKEFGIKLAK